MDFANAKSGKRKSKKETALAGSNPCDIPEDQIPFEIPESWCWCRIDDIFAHNSGKALNKTGNKEGIELEYVTTSNLYWNYFELNNLKTMLFKDSEIEKCTVFWKGFTYRVAIYFIMFFLIKNFFSSQNKTSHKFYTNFLCILHLSSIITSFRQPSCCFKY